MYHNANNALAFVSGWIITTVKAFLVIHATMPFIDFMTKLIGCMVWGAAGGIGTIWVKDIYMWVKKYIRKRQIRKSTLKSKTK